MAHRVTRLVPVGLAAVLVASAAVSTPFTTGSELTVAAGVAIVLGALALRHRRQTVAGGDGDARRGAGAVPPVVADRWSAWRWTTVAAPLALAVAWELWSVAHGPRTTFPTLSSMLDAVDSRPVGRGLVFGAWLALGWALVAR